MAKRLQRKDIFEENLFPVDEANKFLDVLSEIKKEQTELLKSSKQIVASATFSNSTDVRRFEKAISDINAAYKNLIKIERDRTVVTKALQDAERNGIKIQQEQERLRKIQIDNEIKLTKERERQARATEKSAAANRRDADAFVQLSKRVNEAQSRFKSLSAEFGVNDVRARAARIEFERLDRELRKINDAAKDGRRDVGRYEKALGGLRSVLTSIGVAVGIREVINFSQELIALANEAKGVEFAFKRLGAEGQEALDAVRQSSRGLISDLDIKRSLNQFDNFNINLKEADVLFEFLSIRAAQTGQSFELLRDSLVEGLSKQSKLRIDNLGISVLQLNEELERTPDFVQAVANIARKEISEAGSILDSAANSQQKFNVRLQNAKVVLSRELLPVFEAFFSGLNFLLENLQSIGKALVVATAAVSSYVLATRGAIIAQRAYTIAVNVSRAAQNAFNIAVKANPLGIITTLVLTAVTAYEAFGNEVGRSADEQRRLNEELKKAERIKNIQKAYQVFIKAQSLFTDQLDFSKVSTDELRASLEVYRDELEKFAPADFLSKNPRARIFRDRVDVLEAEIKRREELEAARGKNLTKAKAVRAKEVSEEEKFRIFLENELKKTELQSRRAGDTEIQIAENVTGRKVELIQQEIDRRKKSKSEIKGILDLELELQREIDRFNEENLKRQEEILEKRREFIDQSVLDAREKANLINEIEQQQNDIAIQRIDNEIRASERKRRETIFNQEQQFKAIEELERKRFEQSIKALEDAEQFEINIIARSEEEKELIREKFRKQREQIQEDEKERQIQRDKERNDRLVDNLISAGNLISNSFEQANQRRIREIENEIDTQNRALDEQKRRAELGLSNTLAFEQQRAAKLELEREKQAKRDERRAKTLAYFNLVAEFAKSEPNTAPAKALVQTLLADAIAGFFHEGTERVGDDSATRWRNTGKDDYLVAVDKGERIVPTELNNRLGNISNDALVDLVTSKKQSGVYVVDQSGVVQKLNEVVQAVRESGMQVEWNSHDERIERMIKGLIKKVVRTKRNRLW
ncbi:MAG TPA: hypothetical protein VFV37_11095 [Luteibaculaceae bacterium]|nr:hypothetical protein [Luteibaculaceae bacterium]